MFTAALLGTPQFTSNTGTNNTYREKDTPRQEMIMKQARTDVLFTVDDGPSKYMIEIAKTLDSLQYQ